MKIIPYLVPLLMNNVLTTNGFVNTTDITTNTTTENTTTTIVPTTLTVYPTTATTINMNNTYLTNRTSTNDASDVNNMYGTNFIIGSCMLYSLL